MPQVATELEQVLPPGFDKKIADAAWKGGPIAVPSLACMRSSDWPRGFARAC